MKLKTLAVTSAILTCVLSFASFAKDKSSQDILKFNFDNYIKKEPGIDKADIRYKDFPNQRMYYYKLEQGAVIDIHTHDTDQTAYVVKGEGQLRFGQNKKWADLKEGDSFFIPHLVQHKLIAITDLEVVAFNPGTTDNKSSTFKH